MGPKPVSRLRDATIVLLLLALPAVFYVSNNKQVRDYSALDRAVSWVSGPVQWAVVASLDGISHLWHHYGALVDVQADNDALRAQLDRLSMQLQTLQEAARENERLHRLLDVQPNVSGRRNLLGQVIATSPSPLFRSLRINRGSRDGVTLGDAVISHAGLVGRIAALSDSVADVMLLTDANSSADVLVQRSRARIRVRGQGGDHALNLDAQYLGRTADVEPGDVLLTSGLGHTFPKGLSVGRVHGVERRAFGLYQRALVRPSVDFSRLEEVMVLLAGDGAKANDADAPQDLP